MITFLGDIWVTNDEFQLPFFEKSRYVLANLEASFDAGQGFLKENLGPSLFIKRSGLEKLKNSGITHVSLCNNHVLDGGLDGYSELLEMCEAVGLVVVGTKNNWTVDLGDYHVLFVMEEFQRCLASGIFLEQQYLFSRQLDNYIESNKERKIVLYTHHGVEGYYNVLKVYQERLRHLVDLGVDFIIGNGTHVPQTIENYKGKDIVNSLGNFYFSNLHLNLPRGFYVVLSENGLTWSREHLAEIARYHDRYTYEAFVSNAYHTNIMLPLVGNLTLAYTKQKFRRLLFSLRLSSIDKADSIVRNITLNDAHYFLIKEYDRLFNSL